LAGAAWIALLTAVLVSPYAVRSPTLGDDLTRNTVRLALLYYAVAVSLMLWPAPADGAAAAGRGRLARACWTLAWAAYLVHLGMAFHHYHHWSHADAVEHTRAVAGVGEGIYFSHLFTLLWTADVTWWWLRPVRYASRPAWVSWAVHGYLAFITFNGTVVYGDGPIRWAGLVMFATFAALVVYRLLASAPASGRG
jgi:hypothetical protein